MTPTQLDALGASALRQLARQAGLRGASLHDAETLRVGLKAWFARAPERDEDDPDDDSEPSPRGPTRLPPALQTETMAKLLERQGRTDQAAALRADLQAPPDVEESVTLSLDDGEAQVTWQLADQRFPEEGSPAPQAAYQGEIWFWRAGGARVTRRFPVTEAQAAHTVPPPADTRLAVAAVGRKDDGGAFCPVARSPLWRDDAGTA